MTDTTTENLLAFERSWLNSPQHDGAKMKAAYETFGLSLIRYYQILVAALGTREAWELDPVTCGIVTRRMEGAVRSRSLRAG